MWKADRKGFTSTGMDQNETAAEQLSEIEEWDRYKHQKHDLFVSRNEAADQFIEKSNVILALENK